MIIGVKGLGLFGSVAKTAGGPSYDPDAQTYINAVEAADGQALETGVKDAINAFVVGCKSDGIWTAIKASCILAGARTLSGALVPLVGTAPTNNNFVSGDYSRTAGLTGDGSTKYLDSNRLANADPQDSSHLSAYCTSTISTFIRTMIGVDNGSVYSIIQPQTSTSTFFPINDNASSPSTTTNPSGAFFTGVNRASSTGVDFRFGSTVNTRTAASTGTIAFNHYVFARNTSGTPNRYFSSPIAFYSIGEALDLALLDTRVTNLITAIGAAIP